MDGPPVFGIDERRGTFANSPEFVLTCLSFVAGLNGLRCQIQVHDSGWTQLAVVGILSLILAVPYLHLELSLGQISGLGPSGTFAKMAPIFRGLGWTWGWFALIRAFILSMVAAQCILFFFASLRGSLDWAECGHWWNTDNCVDYSKLYQGLQTNTSSVDNSTKSANLSTSFNDDTESLLDASGAISEIKFSDLAVNKLPSIQFYRYFVLGLKTNYTSPNIEKWQLWFPQIINDRTIDDNLSWPQWHTSICMLFVWLLVALSLIGGARIYGKIATFALFLLPTLLLALLLSLLPTLTDVPLFGNETWQKLIPKQNKFWHSYAFGEYETELRTALWFLSTALNQVFWIFGCGFGVYTTLASFHKPHFKRVWPISIVNPLLIVFTGLVFTFLQVIFDIGIRQFIGQLINDKLGLNADQILDQIQLVPQVFATVTCGPLWSAMYYLMIFLFTLAHLIPLFWTGVICIVDEFPVLYARKFTSVVIVVLALILFIFSLLLCTPVAYSIYFLLLNSILNSLYPTLLFVFTVVVLAYGWYNLQKDISLILGIPNSWGCFKRFFGPSSTYHTVSWLILLPAWILALGLGTQWRRVMYETSSAYTFEGIVLPYPYTWISWSLLGLIPCLLVIGMAFGQIIYTKCVAKKPCSVLISTTSRWPTNGTAYLVENQSYLFVPPAGNDRICWCCCNYRTGSFVILIIDLIVYIISFISTVGFIFMSVEEDRLAEKWATIGSSFFSLFIGFLVLGSFYRGLRNSNSTYLAPFLLYLLYVAASTPFIIAWFSFYRKELIDSIYDSSDGADIWSKNTWGTIFDSSVISCVVLTWLFRAWLVSIVAGAHWKFRTEKPVNNIPLDKSDVPLVLTAPTAAPEDDDMLQDKETAALVY